MALGTQSSRQQPASCRAVVEHRDMMLEVVMPPSPIGGALPMQHVGSIMQHLPNLYAVVRLIAGLHMSASVLPLRAATVKPC